MGWADAARRMRVRANAETPNDARVAREFGAEGIGLCRTEHMFFDGERILAVREMILRARCRGTPRRARQAAADPARGFRRALHHHARLAGHDPSARPAAARIPAEDGRGDRRGGSGDAGRAGAAAASGSIALTEVQSDARPSRLPAADHLSGDRRDADPRHPGGGGGGGEEHRRAGRAGDHGAARRHEERARPRQGDDRRDRQIAARRERRRASNTPSAP